MVLAGSLFAASLIVSIVLVYRRKENVTLYALFLSFIPPFVYAISQFFEFKQELDKMDDVTAGGGYVFALFLLVSLAYSISLVVLLITSFIRNQKLRALEK